MTDKTEDKQHLEICPLCCEDMEVSIVRITRVKGQIDLIEYLVELAGEPDEKWIMSREYDDDD